MAEEYFQGEVIAPKAYVGKMVHFYADNRAVYNERPSAALVAFVSSTAVDLYVFPDYCATAEAHPAYGITYSHNPKAGHWTNIPEESE